MGSYLDAGCGEAYYLNELDSLLDKILVGTILVGGVF